MASLFPNRHNSTFLNSLLPQAAWEVKRNLSFDGKTQKTGTNSKEYDGSYGSSEEQDKTQGEPDAIYTPSVV